MSARTLRAVTAITILSLAGLLALQARWLWLGYRDARTVFERRLDLLIAASAERIDPGDELFRQIEAVVTAPAERVDTAIVHEALAHLRANFDTDLQRARPGQFTVLLLRGNPPAYWSDRPVRDTAGIRTARLHMMCEPCNVRIGVLANDAGPMRFLADIGGVVALSVLLIFAQVAGVTFILTNLARLRQRQEEQTAFLNTVAHEFQTPLFSISLAANVLGRSPPIANDAELSGQVALIGRAKERLVVKTKRLLDVAAVGAGNAAAIRAPVAIDDLAREASMQTDALRANAGAELELDLHAGGARVLGDFTQLEQAVVNLLDNAFKYGGNPSRVTLRTRRNGAHASIEVEDNGRGIAQEFHARIFEPFVRIGDGTRHDVQGFGLGLSQVRDVVRRHGGVVALRESPTGGSVFTLTLPLATEPPR